MTTKQCPCFIALWMLIFILLALLLGYYVLSGEIDANQYAEVYDCRSDITGPYIYKSLQDGRISEWEYHIIMALHNEDRASRYRERLDK